MSMKHKRHQTGRLFSRDTYMEMLIKTAEGTLKGQKDYWVI